MKSEEKAEETVQEIIRARAESLGVPLRILEPVSEERRKFLQHRYGNHEPNHRTIQAAGRIIMERIERLILGPAPSEDEKTEKG